MSAMLAANAQVAADVLRRASGSSDGSVLAAMAATRSLSMIVEDTLKALAVQARAEGHTWAEIGQVLRVTRQAAFQRFGPAVAVALDEPADAAPLDRATERTVELVGKLLAGQWEVVEQEFTPKMIEILPRELLESTRARVARHWGALVATGHAAVTVRDGLTVVDLPLSFEHQDASCRAVFDGEGRVAGLLWQPAAGGAA